MDPRELLEVIERAARDRVTELDLSGQKIAALPPEIGQLANLEYLDLQNNQIAALPPEIGQLAKLQVLLLDSNQIVELPPEIGQLAALQELLIDNNQIMTLPSEIGQLANLQGLQLNNNHVAVLPLEISQLASLQVLLLDSNQIMELPPEIGQLAALQELLIDNNQIMTLPSEIGQLANLQGLQLNNNHVAVLPPEIGQLTELQRLYLRENPLSLPPEILARSNEPAAIISYYLEHLGADTRPLNEAKLIVVGQGKVGKNSLVKRLVDDEFDQYELKTEGIDIRPWPIAAGDVEVRLNVWDFGGQEIMHATHQFFLTRRSVYILVLDSRQSDNERTVENWLKLVQSFGGDSPIIVVGNRSDEAHLDLDWAGLQAKYPAITSFARAVSAKTGDGISGLHEIIAESVAALPHINDQLANSWFAVKEELEYMEEDYIPYDRYEEMCRANGIVNEQSRRTLLGFLHDLGIVLHFPGHLLTQDTNVLNPEWVTKGVYSILNANALFQSSGVLHIEELPAIFGDPTTYPPDKHLFIIEMMRHFELCFDFEGEADRRFLIPDLLPRQQPNTGVWSGSLQFQYHYDVLPGSVISRFIVRMNSLISRNTYWRNGVVLQSQDGGNRAIVRADPEERTVYIDVTGDDLPGRRRFLEVIRSQLHAIHETITKLEAREKVPVPGEPKVVADYRNLITQERLGIETFVPEGVDRPVRIKDLLDGVDTAEQRARRGQEDDRDAPFDRPRSARPAPPIPAHAEPVEVRAVNRINPWRAGSFFLIATIALAATFTAVASVLSWVAATGVIVAVLLALITVSAFQANNDGGLGGKELNEIIKEIIQHLPFIRK